MANAETPSFPEAPGPDELVWHYCGAQALQSIVTNHELWASSLAFMNDAREAITGSDALRKHYELISADLTEDVAALVSGSILHPTVDRPEEDHLDTFLLSASLDGDNLSMWRAYGVGEVTYAVGLDPSAPLAPIGRPEDEDPNPSPDYEDDRYIETDEGSQYNSSWDATYFTESHWLLAVYDTEEAQRIIDFTVRQIQDAAQKAADGAVGRPKTAMYLGALFASLEMAAHRDLAIFQIKDPGFVDEREARLVVRAAPAWRFVRYRPSGLGFVPYIRLTSFEGSPPDYPRAGHPLPIRRICIGPTRYPQLARAGLKQMLARKGYHNVEVGLSTIPFRPV